MCIQFLQVLLHSDSDRHSPLVYAASWWCSNTVDEYLRDKSKPIWVSLTQGHLELNREIKEVNQTHVSTAAISIYEIDHSIAFGGWLAARDMR